jgi:septal ring factor EnvC (AmiA/AmiB activator)
MNLHWKTWIILLTGMSISFTGPGLYVARCEKPSSQLKQKEKLKDLEKEVAKKKKNIRKYEAREYSIIKKINEIDRYLDQKNKELAIYESNLAQNQKQKAKANAEILKLEKEINQNLDRLKGRLRVIYKSGGIGLVKVIFSSHSISQLLQSITLMRYVVQSDAEILEIFRQKYNSYQEKIKELEEYNSRVNLYKKRALQVKDTLVRQKKEKKSLLDSVKKDKSRQASLLKDLEKQSEALHRIIENGIRGTINCDDFVKMKGHLIWPVQGSVLVPFGLQYDSSLNRKVLNNGIDIKASFGSDIVSVAPGKVIYAGWFLGYGKMVIIDHGNGYNTIYAHASNIFVREGQSIKTGEKIAAVGDTDSFRGPELYFEVRHRGRPYNPLSWLGRRYDKMSIRKEGLPNNR